MDCGRPDSGPVVDNMRSTRAAYHYTIRGVREIETAFCNLHAKYTF